MATELETQAGFFSDGRVRFGVDATTHALVPNPLDSALVDLGASDAQFKQLHTSAGFPTATPLLTTTKGATVKIVFVEEEITLSTGGSTTDSTANLLPANSLILNVSAIVTTTITSATDWKVGDGSTADRFCAVNSTLTAGTTSLPSGLHFDPSKAAGYSPYQVAAAKVRITTSGTPAAGKIRVSVIALTMTAPTS